jgi:hypothetical protein
MVEATYEGGTGDLPEATSHQSQRRLHPRPSYRVTLVLLFNQLSEAWEVRRLRGFRESIWEAAMLTGHSKCSAILE